MPLTVEQKWLIGLSIGGVLAAGVAWWILQPPQVGPVLAAAQPPLDPGNVQTITLSPGAMAEIDLSSASPPDAISIQAPTGGTLQSMTADNVSVFAPPTTGAMYELVAAAAGSATITATYTDTSGVLQTSTIPVTISDSSTGSGDSNGQED